MAGATVTLWRLGWTISEPVRDIEATTRTALDGTFAFDRLFPTRYLVDAETQTHTSLLRLRSTQNPARQASADVSFEGVAHASDVIVTIYPVGGLSGRVTRPDGTPVPNAIVNAESPLQSAAFGEVPVKTNAKGEYRIDRLPEGSYIVSVNHSARTDFEARGQRVPVDYRDYVETFYSGTDQRERATRIDVRTGAETPNVDITLALEQRFTIVGRILHPTGPMPKAIWLEWGTRDGMIYGDQVVEGSNGPLAIRGVIGQVGILARAMTAKDILNATATVTVTSGPVRDIYLRLAPAARVRGTLVIEGGRLLPQGVYPEVALQPPWPRVPSFTEGPRPTLPVEVLRNADPELYSVPVLQDVHVRIHGRDWGTHLCHLQSAAWMDGHGDPPSWPRTGEWTRDASAAGDLERSRDSYCGLAMRPNSATSTQRMTVQISLQTPRVATAACLGCWRAPPTVEELHTEVTEQKNSEDGRDE